MFSKYTRTDSTPFASQITNDLTDKNSPVTFSHEDLNINSNKKSEIHLDRNFNLNTESDTNIDTKIKTKSKTDFTSNHDFNDPHTAYLLNGPILFDFDFIKQQRKKIFSCSEIKCGYLVHFTGGTVHENFLQNISDIEIVSYIPNDSFYIFATNESIKKLPKNIAITEFTPKYKISPLINLSGEGPIFDVSTKINFQKSKNQQLTITIHIDSIDELQVLIEKWKTKLQTKIKIVSNRILIVTCTEENISNIVTFLSEQEQVTWIEPKIPIQMNNIEATATLQSGRKQNANRIYHETGIRGQNQIIAIADSFLDVDHCFFSDPDTSVQYCDECTHGSNSVNCTMSSSRCTSPSSHRKIAAYWNYAHVDRDEFLEEEDNSHGTHTCGSALGSTDNKQLSSYGGQAPDAKLAFTQVGPSILIPDDLYRYATNIHMCTQICICNSFDNFSH
jgi:hypothetical protein